MVVVCETIFRVIHFTYLRKLVNYSFLNIRLYSFIKFFGFANKLALLEELSFVVRWLSSNKHCSNFSIQLLLGIYRGGILPNHPLIWLPDYDISKFAFDNAASTFR